MDKSALLKKRLPQAKVDIEGLGEVTVRGLTRAEVLHVREATDNENMDGDRALVLERKLLAVAMVDPKLTEDEVGQWQEMVTPGELEPVIEKLQELSGLLPGSSKSSLYRVRERSGSGVRVLPCREARYDRG